MESAFCGYCEVEELFSVVYLVAYTTVKMKNVETEKKNEKQKTRKAIKMNQLELWKSNQSKLSRIVNVYYELQCALIVRCRLVDVSLWLGRNRRELTVLEREPQNIRNDLISGKLHSHTFIHIRTQ